jgi:hypothetical protein
MWRVSEIKIHEEVLAEDVVVGETIDVVEIVVVGVVMVDREDHHRIAMTTIVGVVVLLSGTVIIEVEIGTMTIEDVGIDLPWEVETLLIEVALPVVVVAVATVVGAEAGQGRLGHTARGVLLGMLEEEEVAMTTVIGVVLETMVIGVLGTMIIGIAALMATVNEETDIEEDEMIADIVLEQCRVAEQNTDNKLCDRGARHDNYRDRSLDGYRERDGYRGGRDDLGLTFYVAMMMPLE